MDLSFSKRSESFEEKISQHLALKNSDSKYAGSFECGSRELLLWLIVEEEIIRNKTNTYEGLDGPEAEESNNLMTEYRIRLRELKRLHGIQ